MYKKILISLILLVSSAQAHTAIMSCFDNGDENIVCEGGFSDGSSASGILFFIKQNETTIMETRMNEDSEVVFRKSQGAYTVHFDAGEGHKIAIKGEDIVE